MLSSYPVGQQSKVGQMVKAQSKLSGTQYKLEEIGMPSICRLDCSLRPHALEAVALQTEFVPTSVISFPSPIF